MAKQVRAATLGVLEFAQRFPDEDAAVAYFEAMRWGETPTCPRCSHADKITDCRRKYFRWCGRCRQYFTVKIGTVMEASNVPIRKWLLAMYFLVTARKGVSSLQLAKELHISQPTAWFLLHRLREACGVDSAPLSGAVEVDEAYFGGRSVNKHARKKHHAGRGPVGKQAVIGLRQRGGRTVVNPIDETSAATLETEIQHHVSAGASVYTDDHRGYLGLRHLPYHHATVKHSVKEFVNGAAHTNGIESVWAVLKRGYHGVYHNWSVKHMQRYTNEFAFRLNEGNVKRDTMDRLRSLSQALVGKRLTYAGLVGS